MAFKGITFAGQNVTPKNDGGLYQAHCGDGILWGCSMAISGDDLVIQSGEFIAGGRVCWVDGSTSVDLSGRGISTGYIQVIMNFDMTQGEGSQWYTTYVESASTTFPSLTQDAINDTGDLYQFELAVVQVSGGNLTSVYSSASMGDTRVVSPNGNIIGRIFANDGGASWMSLQPDGVSYGGIYVDSLTNATVFGKNGVYIRPNGIQDNTGQIIVNPSGVVQVGGQIVGGHPVTVGTAQSTSVSAGTNTRINQISGLTSGGYYHIDGYVALTHNSNVTGHCRLTICNGTSPANAMISNSLYNAGNSYRYISVSATLTGYTEYNLAVNCDNASTIRGTRFTAYRID